MMETMEFPVRRGNVALKIARGHFATNHSHINYYIDITDQKVRLSSAKAVAKALASQYSGTPVEAILCLDGMGLVGACLAEALTSASRSINDSNNIALVEPEYSSAGQMIFRDNIQPYIRGKHVLILMASVTTGYTANRGVQSCIYYGGQVVGVAGIYRAVDKLDEGDYPVRSVYSVEDLPDYESFSYSECPHCKAGVPIDALVNSFGYSKF